MQQLLYGLAVVLIRTDRAARLAEWYAGVLGLPIIRGREPTFYLSLGDTTVLELLADKGAPKESSVPWSQTPLYLVIGSLDLATTALRLRQREAVYTEYEQEGQKEVRLNDPDGNHICIRQDPSARASSFRPACSPLPPDLVGLSGLVRICANAARAFEFYTEVVGLEVTAPLRKNKLLSLGQNIWLELRGGGKARTMPKKRSDVRISYILRASNHNAASDLAAARGAPVVEKDLHFNSTSLSYFADPEGQLWAIDERYHPERYKISRRPFAEDTEILRRLSH